MALTLPEEVVSGLRKINADLAWAVVTLFEKTGKRQRVDRLASDKAELVSVGGPRSLIVVPRQLFLSLDLPGVNILPLHGDHAFLALQPGRGMSDLVLAVEDRLATPSIGRRHAEALRQLRTQLQEWRNDRHLRCETRTIIVIERRRSRRTTRAT